MLRNLLLTALLAQTTASSLGASEVAVVAQASAKPRLLEYYTGIWNDKQYFVSISGVPDISKDNKGLSATLVSKCVVCNSDRSVLFAESLRSHVLFGANKDEVAVKTDGTTSKGNGNITMLSHTNYNRVGESKLGKCSFWTIIAIGNFGSGDALVSDSSIFQTDQDEFTRLYPQGIAFFMKRGEAKLLVNN